MQKQQLSEYSENLRFQVNANKYLKSLNDYFHRSKKIKFIKKMTYTKLTIST